MGKYKTSYLEIVYVIIGSTCLTILFTFPFILNINSFYMDTWDYSLNGWILWHNYNSLSSLDFFKSFSSYFETNIFFPLPTTLAYSEHLFIPALIIFSPIFLISKNIVFSVNFFTFLTFVATFISSYMLSKTIIKNNFGAFVSAAIFTFNPLTFAHFPQHLQLMSRFFIPMCFLYGYKYVQTPSYKNSFLFFTFFTLNSLSVIYYQLFVALTLPVFLLPTTINKAKLNPKSYFSKILLTSLVGLIFLPIIFIFNKAYLDFSKKENIVRNLNETIYFSARITDWVSPSNNNFIYAPYVSSIENFRIKIEPTGGFRYQEHTLGVNLIVVLLVVIGTRQLLKKKKYNILISLWVLLLWSFLLSLGPFLVGFRDNYTKLPYYYIYEITTILKGIRVPSRFQFISYIPISILAGFGATFFFDKLSKVKSILALLTIFLAIIFLETYTPNNFSQKSQMIEYFKNNQKVNFLENSNTVHIPTLIENPRDNTKYINWSTQSKENILNGYSGYIPQDIAEILSMLNNSNLTDLELDILKSIDINFIIAHSNIEVELPIFYQDQKVTIYSLAKYKHKRCMDTNSLSYNTHIQDDGDVVIEVKNPKGCITSFTKNSRYKESIIKVNGKEQKTYLKFPLVIHKENTELRLPYIKPEKIQKLEVVIQELKIKHYEEL